MPDAFCVTADGVTLVRRRLPRWLLALAAAVVALALTGPAVAGDVHQEGRAEMPLKIERDEAGATLHLNGAATLRRYFVRIYSIGLYTPEPTTDADRIIEADDQPRRVHIFFAYRSIGGQAILDAWEDGLDDNLEGELRDAMDRAIRENREVFKVDVQTGDEIIYDYTPDEGTRIYLNDDQVAFIEDPLYFRALLSFWIGERPVDSGARSGLLKGGYR